MNFIFGITWLFDKLGYMPKIDMEVGKVELNPQNTWPFPVKTEKPKTQGKKTASKKPAVKKATTRKPKVK
jgi:hypothetical protein